MKHTIGYNVSTTIPITIAYRCSRCKFLNIHTVTLTEEAFRVSKRDASESTLSAIESRIKVIQESTDNEVLKNASISGKCSNCKNIEKWSSKDRIPVLAWMFIIYIIAFFCVFIVFAQSTH